MASFQHTLLLKLGGKNNERQKEKERSVNCLVWVTYSRHLDIVIDVVESKWKRLEGQNHSFSWFGMSDASYWVSTLWNFSYCPISTYEPGTVFQSLDHYGYATELTMNFKMDTKVDQEYMHNLFQQHKKKWTLPTHRYSK